MTPSLHITDDLAAPVNSERHRQDGAGEIDSLESIRQGTWVGSLQVTHL